MNRTLLILPLLVVGPCVAAEITLRDDADVSGGSLVRLGDVAKITGADAERLATLPLMPTPATGSRQFLSASAVRDMLSAQGEDPQQHRFAGAYRVAVRSSLGTPVSAARTPSDEWRQVTPSTPNTPSTAFRVRPGFQRSFAEGRPMGSPRVQPRRSRQQVEDAVAAAVQAAVDAADPANAWVVRGVELNQTAWRELGVLSVQELNAALDDEVAAGRLVARVWPESRAGEEPFRVVVDLIAQPMRLVATQPISRGTPLTASAVRVEPVPLKEIDRPQSRGYEAVDQALGRETTRNIREGDVLSQTNTAAPLLVRRNEEVAISSGSGGVSVRVRAVAKQDGRAGELVPIETLDRGERFMARVVGPRRLAVLSAGAALADMTRSGGLQ